jgi:hypothetical protein
LCLACSRRDAKRDARSSGISADAGSRVPAQQQAMSLRDVTVVSKAGCRGREVGGVDGEDAVDDEKVEGVLWIHYARTDS